ncbi:nitrous oxide reductase family maturation protein NosD [Catalinimonas niigatensis]|uniref:nitrous oxide reductase family maturation protein NosD n=1 Tax=Catalinimonas niigatensis TaxID=1397264 RepID=UPI0026670D21|nr:nitrous oxide reductase family maturation protein NosD [Catalinimonas niigatensis]WPP48006.1 nitrous oxide reductase family maturation protein NosD [Catalinimonas niigatensis]
MKTLLYICCFCWLNLASAYAKTIYVGADQQHKSVSNAIQMANAGDTIVVEKGIYKEGNIIIDKPLVLLGQDFPVLDGENQNEILTITADSVTVSGFKIQNVGISYLKDQAGIKLSGSRGSTIRGNQLMNTFFGVMLEESVHCTVNNNEIIGNAENEASSGNAIHLWYCDSITIKNNIVKNHRDGIYLEFVNYSSIEENVSEGNLRYGLHFMFSNHDNYLGNIFRNNGAGVAVMFSKQINMQHNIFEKNWGSASYGLLLKEIFDSQITHNEFTENTSGIYAEGANRCQITHNNFRRNGWALRISGSSDSNVFTRNNFLSNTFDLSTNSQHNYNTYESNYWSEYSGYDLDKDGVGDVPYHPVKLFSYVINRVQPSIILLRSLFIDIINFAEKVAPAITPQNLVDPSPLMKPVS